MIKFQHVANLVKAKRRGHPGRYSQEEIGEYLGFTGHLISNIERGLSSVAPRNVIALCEVLDISYEEMIEAIVADFEHGLRSTLQRQLFKKPRNKV